MAAASIEAKNDSSSLASATGLLLVLLQKENEEKYP